MEKKLVKEVLLATGFGLVGGVALAAVMIVLVALGSGELELALRWGRAVAVIAGGW